jgi:hypothetical protein
MKWVCYYFWMFITCALIMGYNFYFAFGYKAHKCTPPATNGTAAR